MTTDLGACDFFAAQHDGRQAVATTTMKWLALRTEMQLSKAIALHRNMRRVAAS